MYSVTIYHRGRKTVFTSNNWHDLRGTIAAKLKHQPEAKWGELREEQTIFVKRYRKRMTNYPLQKPKT